MNISVQTSSMGADQTAESPDTRRATIIQQPTHADRAVGSLGRWMGKTYELSDSSTRLRSMEGLRGLAVALVFFVHFHALFSHYVIQTPLLWQVSSFLGHVGNSGVDLFFVLSGFLIYSALIRHKSTLRCFLARRATRIYPTFFAVFVLYLALSELFPQNSKLHGYRPLALAVYLAQNMLLLPGIFPILPIITVSWSLSYEALFYVSAAALIYGMRLWNWAAAARIALFTVILISYVALCFSLHQAHVRALMFIAGVLLYEALASPHFRGLLRRPREVIVIIAFVLSLSYAYLLDIRPEFFSSLPGWSAGRSMLVGVPGYQGPYKAIILGLTMFWFVGHCFADDTGLMRIFSVAPLRYLGNMSYSYYLIHGLALQALALLWALVWPRNNPSIAAFATAFFTGFAATWVASTILFMFIEKPFSLKHNMRAVKLSQSGGKL